MKASDILTRLKAATGPDRDLDIAVGDFWPDPKPFSQSIMQQRGGKPPVFVFTTSIDASLALVERMLPGCMGNMYWGGERPIMASVLREDGSRPYFSGETPALAILCALFEALAARDAREAE